MLEMASVVRCQVIVTCQSCIINSPEFHRSPNFEGLYNCFQQKKSLLKGSRQSSRHHSCQNLPLHVYVDNNMSYTRCLFLARFGTFELPLTPQNYLSEPALDFQVIGNMRLSIVGTSGCHHSASHRYMKLLREMTQKQKVLCNASAKGV